MTEQKKTGDKQATEKKDSALEKPAVLAVLEKEKAELVDALQHLQAEFENYKKRVEKEKLFCEQFGKAKAVAELLQLLDSFDAAEQRAKKENKKDEGLVLLHKLVLQAMQKLGLQEIKTAEQQFNHETMDCVMQGNEKEKKDNAVLEEFLKGYLLDGKVLRHAKVKVNKCVEPEPEKNIEGKNPEIREKK